MPLIWEEEKEKGYVVRDAEMHEETGEREKGEQRGREGEKEQKAHFSFCFPSKKPKRTSADNLLKPPEQPRTRPGHSYRRELGAVLRRSRL